MDKKLHHILNRSNLTPRERFLLLIQNDVEAHKTGKSLLTEADKAALENWNATKNEDAREWNMLNDGWRYSGRMGLESELHFHDAQAAHLQTRPIIMELIKYPLYREMRLMLESIKNIKKTTPAEAAEIAAKQRTVKLEEGMEYGYVLYRLAFESMGAEDQKRLNELYADIETDHTYLDQEEIIANLLDGKEELTQATKEKLAELIASRAYNAFAKEHQLFHYFACIPLAEVARHFLAWKGVTIGGKPLAQNQEADDEDNVTHKQIHKAIEEYAKEYHISVEEILKEGFIHWYDEEGFAYTPLILSDDKELFLRWLASKAAARMELEKLVAAGTLILAKQSPQSSYRVKAHIESLRESGNDSKVISGESLYAWQADFEFVQDFKKRVDTYDPNLGLVYADNDPEHKGENLDQEFLICDTDERGNPIVLSRYGLAFARLEGSFESVTFFEEERRSGKTHIVFKNKGVERMFRDSREQFIAGYAKLLALKEVTDKLSAIYETDLAFRLAQLFALLDGYIKTHNDALDTARKGMLYKYMSDEEPPIVAQIDPTLYIDKNAIAPDQSVVEEHTTKLKKIFWNF